MPCPYVLFLLRQVFGANLLGVTAALSDGVQSHRTAREWNSLAQTIKSLWDSRRQLLMWHARGSRIWPLD